MTSPAVPMTQMVVDPLPGNPGIVIGGDPALRARPLVAVTLLDVPTYTGSALVDGADNTSTVEPPGTLIALCELAPTIACWFVMIAMDHTPAVTRMVPPCWPVVATTANAAPLAWSNSSSGVIVIVVDATLVIVCASCSASEPMSTFWPT